jgi:hypothetical protein
MLHGMSRSRGLNNVLNDNGRFAISVSIQQEQCVAGQAGIERLFFPISFCATRPYQDP